MPAQTISDKLRQAGISYHGRQFVNFFFSSSSFTSTSKAVSLRTARVQDRHVFTLIEMLIITQCLYLFSRIFLSPLKFCFVSS